MRGLLALLTIIILLAAFASVYAQLSETEAEQKFNQYGCTNCHTEGGAADPWDEVLDEIRAWATEYGSLDEGARHVVYFGQSGKFNSFDELISQMASNVGKSPSDISDLVQFLKNEFNEAKGTAGGSPSPSPTTGGGGGGLPTELLYAIIIFIIIIVIIVAYVMRRR